MRRGRKPEPPWVTVEVRDVAGVRVRFRYDRRRRAVTLTPNEGDISRAAALSILRLWCMMGQWAEGVSRDFPGWTVDGAAPSAAAGFRPAPGLDPGGSDGEGAG